MDEAHELSYHWRNQRTQRGHVEELPSGQFVWVAEEKGLTSDDSVVECCHEK